MGRQYEIIEYESDTFKKYVVDYTFDKRLYVTSLPVDISMLGSFIRNHWSIESMHWGLNVNIMQDKIK